VGDLQGLLTAMNTFYPLAVGAVWKYKATDAAGTDVKVEVRVQGELPGAVKGLYRVSTKLPGDLVTTSLEATTAQAVLRRKSVTDEHSPWEVWWPLTASDGEAVTAGKYTFRVSDAPAVSVPFGEFPARKVEKMDAEGQVLATAWFAENLGLIKMEDLENSMTQVLIQYSPPGP
jgi:hypothetical protein